MKKLLVAFIALCVSFTAMAAEEKAISESQLPQTAQTFIKQYYPKDKVAIATVERDFLAKDYKVILTSGTLLEFDAKGAWTDIEVKRNQVVPIELVNPQIVKYVESRFPESKIVKIDRSKKEIEVKLDNAIELTFNQKGVLTELDD